MLASDCLTKVLWCAVIYRLQNTKAKEPKPTKTFTKKLNALNNRIKIRQTIYIFLKMNL